MTDAQNSTKKCREIAEHFLNSASDFARRLDSFPAFDEALRSLDPEIHWWASVRLDLAELLFGTRVTDSPTDPDLDSLLGRLRAGLDADDPKKRSALAAAVNDFPDLVAPTDDETASATRHQVREE